jgi:hypothetical protein
MQGINPIRPRFGCLKPEDLLAVGNCVMYVMLKTEDIRTLQTIGAISPDDRTG